MKISLRSSVKFQIRSLPISQALQNVASPGQILVKEDVFERVKESFNCRKVGEVKLKNKSNPITIYDVLD